MTVAGQAQVQDQSIDILLQTLLAASGTTSLAARKQLFAKNLSGSARCELRWHIDHTLSERQREVITYHLMGKKEREIAVLLGIRQQVVNIYKHRALKKLRQIFSSNGTSQASIE